MNNNNENKVDLKNQRVNNEKLVPALSNNIFDCVKFHKNQYIVSNPILFTIYPNNIYSNNDEICITNIKYSYDYIALPSPIPFYICNNKHYFYGANGEYFYEIDSIQKEIQDKITKAIEDAESIIERANSDRQTLIRESNSLGTNIIDAFTVIKELIKFQYPSPEPGSLEEIFIDALESFIYVSQANSLFSTLLNGVEPTIVEEIALNIYDDSEGNDSAVDYIIKASNLILNYPNASQNAILFARNALGLANNLISIVNNILTSLGNQTIETINNLIVRSLSAVGFLFDGFDDLVNNFGNEEIEKYSKCIPKLFDASENLRESVVNINSNENEQALDNIIAGANLVIEALNCVNSIEKIYFYNTFESVVSSSNCNCCFTNMNTDNYTKSEVLFHEKLGCFRISNLCIEICGTIGGKEFLAVSNNQGVVKLACLGLQPIDVKANISIPKNLVFSLIQNINESFYIDCVIPTKNYDINNPNTIELELSFCFDTEIELLAVIKKALSIYTIE